MPGIDAFLVLLHLLPVCILPIFSIILMNVPNPEVRIISARIDRQTVCWKLHPGMCVSAIWPTSGDKCLGEMCIQSSSVIGRYRPASPFVSTIGGALALVQHLVAVHLGLPVLEAESLLQDSACRIRPMNCHSQDGSC